MALDRSAPFTPVDDSGDALSGDFADAAWVAVLQDRVDARWSEKTITLIGSQNNVSITEAGVECDVLRCNNASDLTITGIAAPASPVKPGKKLLVVSVGAGNVYLPHQSGSSSAANQIITFITTGVGTPLAAGVGMALLEYDETTDRWRLVLHEQGAGITPSFNAADFGASGGGTWTVGSGDVTTMRLSVRGRRVKLDYYVVTTTVSGTPADLRIGNGQWGGYTISKTKIECGVGSNNGGANEATYAQVVAAGIIISISQLDAGTWSNATNTTAVYGSIEFEVD